MLDELMFCAAAGFTHASRAARSTAATGQSAMPVTTRSPRLIATSPFRRPKRGPYPLFSAKKGYGPFFATSAALIAHPRRAQSVQVDFVDLVDDLGERPHGRFEAGFRHDGGGVQIRVIERVIDDVEARRIGEDHAELAARPRLRPRVDRNAERLEAVGDDRLELIA